MDFIMAVVYLIAIYPEVNKAYFLNCLAVVRKLPVQFYRLYIACSCRNYTHILNYCSSLK